MNKKISLGAAATLIIISVALTFSVTMVIAMRHFNYTMGKVSQRQAMFDYITVVDKEVRQNYPGTINEATLRASIAKGYIEGIDDPYAAYLSADDYKKETDRLSGKRMGLGLEAVRLSDGSVVISSVQKNSAANKAGLKKGDVITQFDGKDVKSLGFAQIKYKLNTADKVKLTVNRNKNLIAFEISASSYSITSVESRLIGTTGYIRISAFYSNTPEQFRDAYTALEEKGAENYIFDIRYNKGGDLNAVGDVIGYLIPRGTYANRVTPGTLTELVSKGAYEITKPSVTLVNNETEGEAELFAGVLKEFRKTNVAGVTTAGRGLVQKFYTLSDGAAIKLSVASLSLVSGATIEGIGIEPDVTAELPSDLANRFAFLTEDNDPQLIAALATLKGGTVTTNTTASTATTTETTAATASATTTTAKAK